MCVCKSYSMDSLLLSKNHVLWLTDSHNFNHLFVNSERVVVEKWGITGKHFVDEDPEGPPVHGLIVTLALDDLGSQVLGGAT